jgi:UDP-N-acetylmuramoyl-L-alanyl-D-glutamate--2,6-diaminopimelate ligase
MRKIGIPDRKYKFITDDSRFCDSETAFLLTHQNREFSENSCQCNIELSDIRELFGIGEIKIIGITGTNGKTTTASLFYSILLDLGYSVALQGTRGFFINDKKVEEHSHTTPPILDTYRHIYQARAENCDFFVMEVSSHSISQNRIESLDFALKVHTNITGDHLDFHGTMAEYVKVKNSFFTDESMKLLNRDDKYVEFNYKNAYTYSLESGSSFKLLAYTMREGVSGVVQFFDEVEDFHSPMYGFFNLYNILASVAGVKLLTQKPMKDICEVVENFAGVSGRMEVISEKPLVIVDFAHTPDGMEKVLDSLREKDVIVVFGAGGDRDKIKRPKMGKIANNMAKHLIVTSDNPRNEDPQEIANEILSGIEKLEKVDVILNRKEAIRRGLELQSGVDVLLILGKGDETEQVIYDQKFHFDDREIARELLSEIQKS